jgi:hypothetical protein
MTGLRALARLRPVASLVLRSATAAARPELLNTSNISRVVVPLSAVACSALSAHRAPQSLWTLQNSRSLTTSSSSGRTYSKDDLARHVKTSDLAHLLHDAGIDFRDCLERCAAALQGTSRQRQQQPYHKCFVQ